MKLTVKSAAFKEGELIPKPYTCDGKNVSPPISWEHGPVGTKVYALICDDPDAPMGAWVHWVLFNLPANAAELPENVPSKETLENGAKHGINDFRKLGYGGPCPPSGTHRYFFRVYALDVEISLKTGASKAELVKAMKGHVLAEGQLMGKYKR